MTKKYLSRPEEIVLMAVKKLGPGAYGVTIRDLVQEMTGKYWSIGAIYVPLERLEKKGYLISSNSDPKPERGGRRKRVFELTSGGVRELDELYRINSTIWRGYSRLAPDSNKGS